MTETYYIYPNDPDIRKLLKHINRHLSCIECCLIVITMGISLYMVERAEEKVKKTKQGRVW